MTLTVATEVTWFYGHWDKIEGRTRRCGGEVCALCEIGQKRTPYFYLGVVEDDGPLRVLECGRSLRSLVEYCNENGVESIGRRFRVRKKGVERNSSFEYELMGRVLIDELTLEPFVATLGLEPLLTVELGGRIGQILNPNS